MVQWDDIGEMLDDISKHVQLTGDTILSADSPPNIGFIAYRENSPNDFRGSWTIPTSLVRTSIDQIYRRDPIKARLIQDSLSTSAGKKALCASFLKKPLPPTPPTRFEREEPL